MSDTATVEKKSPTKQTYKPSRDMMCQVLRTKSGVRAGLLISVASPDSPHGFKIGWSKVDLTPVKREKRITIPFSEKRLEYIKSQNAKFEVKSIKDGEEVIKVIEKIIPYTSPTDTYDFSEGVRVASKKLSGYMNKTELEMKESITNYKPYVSQLRVFIARAMQYYKVS